MRPRDILNRRKKIYFMIVAISFLTMVIVAFSEKYLPQSLYDTISLGAITVFAAGVLLVYVGIKCPKCNAILGLKFVYAEETLSRCPRCGINFDEDSL
jgi:glucose-6-phosphate-specific signal transduction histidine kinase